VCILVAAREEELGKKIYAHILQVSLSFLIINWSHVTVSLVLFGGTSSEELGKKITAHTLQVRRGVVSYLLMLSYHPVDVTLAAAGYSLQLRIQWSGLGRGQGRRVLSQQNWLRCVCVCCVSIQTARPFY
jgi:hypothetical protein